MMHFIIVIGLCAISGTIGAIMDIVYSVENKTIYWAIGSLFGFIVGIMVGGKL